MSKVAIFIDHDILIRHFILNRALRVLEERHDVVYVFPKNHKRVKYDIHSLPLPKIREVEVDLDRAHRFRRLFHATVLRNMRFDPKGKSLVKFYLRVLGKKPFLKSWLASLPLVYPVYRSWTISRIGDNPELRDLLNQEKPEIIIHPTVLEGLFVSDLISWGEKTKQPTLFLMNSWDNPATKAMMMGSPERLVVWGEQTKNHAIRYLNIPKEKIVCLGAAQFDHYKRLPKVSREEWRKNMGVPGQKRVLLYAGSSKGLNETRHLDMLEKSVEDGTLKDCLVVFRPHPWRQFPEGEEDFFAKSFKHVVMDPKMVDCYKQARAKERMTVELANYDDTHVILNAVDAVISPLSTILLESTLHGKPVAVYLPDEELKNSFFTALTSEMVHFDEFYEQVSCVKCFEPGDLVKVCNQILDMSQEPGMPEKLMEQSNYFVNRTRQSYGEEVRTLAEELISKN